MTEPMGVLRESDLFLLQKIKLEIGFIKINVLLHAEIYYPELTMLS